ncbi:MAG: DUF3823 domain-containing protein [Bacteroidales bacterium]|nr:DUF3823 domain-containing protein [Bacteroides sp.]MCM1501908.1 DUF3823 domain-containing protein [Bacteroidales bacterium]
MRKIALYTIAVSGLMSMASCSLFKLDNYEAPDETLKGRVMDMDGNPVLTDQGSEGIRVRLLDLEWEDAGNEVTPQDFNCRPDGTFQNTKLFPGRYNVTVDGPFVPIVMDDAQGVPVLDGSQDINIRKGVPCEVDFYVQPFLKVEFEDYPQVADGKVVAKVRVSRAISRNDLKAAISKTGDWKDEYANVTDIQLYVGYNPSVGYRSHDNEWSSYVEYSGSSFESKLGQVIELRTNGVIPSGRQMYVRVAARINYETANVRRYNYTETFEVLIP